MELETAGACRADRSPPDLPFARLQAALRLRPRRALSSAEATDEITETRRTGNRVGSLFRF